jgi:hypothetical protein
MCASEGQDAEMMEQIERDVMRTHPDMHFFSGDDPSATTHREVRWPAPRCIPTVDCKAAPYLLGQQDDAFPASM